MFISVHSTQSNFYIQCDPSQNTKGIFSHPEKAMLKFTWKHKGHQILKTIFTKAAQYQISGHTTGWLQSKQPNTGEKMDMCANRIE